MADVRLIVASAIAALVVSVAVAADESAVLGEARQLFQPLSKETSTAKAAPVSKELRHRRRLLDSDWQPDHR